MIKAGSWRLRRIKFGNKINVLNMPPTFDRVLIRDAESDPAPLFGLYTSPANAAYVPRGFISPTDFVANLRLLLLRRAYQLYSDVCRLAPPPLMEKPLPQTSEWHPDQFEWGDPVGDVSNVPAFLEYRRALIDNALDERLAEL